jgi:hypothetical protein
MYLSLLAASLLALAQPAPMPDFSGHWRMDPARSGSPTQSQPVLEMTFVIEQVADQIRLDMQSSNRSPITATYVVGPAPKLPADALGAGQQRAYWDGKQLIVERGGTISGQTVSSKQTLTLSPDQSELIVERVVIVQHGYTLKGTNNYATVKDVFVRAAR